MWLIVGLGNIGNGFNNTYHNVGFMVADSLAKKLDIKFNEDKCKAILGFGECAGEEVIIAKPKTFMNLSGKAVAELIKRYKIKKRNLIITYDDIDLPRGKVRYRENGSAGTHNGMRSIVECLQDTDFQRVRVGVGRNEGMDLADYVLSKIDPYSFDTIKNAVNEASDMIINLIEKGTNV